MKKQENLQNDKFLYLFLNRVYPLRNKDTLASKELDTAFYKFEWAAWIQKIGFCKCGNKIMKLKLKKGIFFVNCSPEAIVHLVQKA